MTTTAAISKPMWSIVQLVINWNWFALSKHSKTSSGQWKIGCWASLSLVRSVGWRLSTFLFMRHARFGSKRNERQWKRNTHTHNVNWDNQMKRDLFLCLSFCSFSVVSNAVFFPLYLKLLFSFAPCVPVPLCVASTIPYSWQAFDMCSSRRKPKRKRTMRISLSISKWI